MTRTDPQINFDWRYRPDPTLPARPFSARWQGEFTFAGGTYRFTVTVSGGVRVYIDGRLVFDRWKD